MKFERKWISTRTYHFTKICSVWFSFKSMSHAQLHVRLSKVFMKPLEKVLVGQQLSDQTSTDSRLSPPISGPVQKNRARARKDCLGNTNWKLLVWLHTHTHTLINTRGCDTKSSLLFSSTMGNEFDRINNFCWPSFISTILWQANQPANQPTVFAVCNHNWLSWKVNFNIQPTLIFLSPRDEFVETNFFHANN